MPQARRRRSGGGDARGGEGGAAAACAMPRSPAAWPSALRRSRRDSPPHAGRARRTPMRPASPRPTPRARSPRSAAAALVALHAAEVRPGLRRAARPGGGRRKEIGADPRPPRARWRRPRRVLVQRREARDEKRRRCRGGHRAARPSADAAVERKARRSSSTWDRHSSDLEATAGRAPTPACRR